MDNEPQLIAVIEREGEEPLYVYSEPVDRETVEWLNRVFEYEGQPPY